MTRIIPSGLQSVYAFRYAEGPLQGICLQVCRASLARIIEFFRYAKGPWQRLCLYICRASVARIRPSGMQKVNEKDNCLQVCRVSMTRIIEFRKKRNLFRKKVLHSGQWVRGSRAKIVPSGMQSVCGKDYAFRFAERLWKVICLSGMQRVHGKDFASRFAERL